MGNTPPPNSLSNLQSGRDVASSLNLPKTVLLLSSVLARSLARSLVFFLPHLSQIILPAAALALSSLHSTLVMAVLILELLYTSNPGLFFSFLALPL